MKLSPQKELIVSTLRDKAWHCGREWLNQIKDDRKRISELNEGYMKEKGYVIKGEPCKGAVCGVKDCPLFKRRAEKLRPSIFDDNIGVFLRGKSDVELDQIAESVYQSL